MLLGGEWNIQPICSTPKSNRVKTRNSKRTRWLAIIALGFFHSAADHFTIKETSWLANQYTESEFNLAACF